MSDVIVLIQPPTCVVILAHSLAKTDSSPSLRRVTSAVRVYPAKYSNVTLHNRQQEALQHSPPSHMQQHENKAVCVCSMTSLCNVPAQTVLTRSQKGPKRRKCSCCTTVEGVIRFCPRGGRVHRLSLFLRDSVGFAFSVRASLVSG